MKRKPEVTHQQHTYTYLIHHSAATSAQNIKRQVVLWAHSCDRTVNDIICVQPRPCSDLPVVFRNADRTIPNKRRGFSFYGNSSTQECGSPYLRGLTSFPNNMSWTRLIMHVMALFFATHYCNFMISYCLTSASLKLY
jgi:hypothetical protein